ncbi:PTS system mannose/fructose/sorbose family transporter subunit IID [Plantactinospora sonchi]|uniref:PTS system mannose/fructose/sorbose family transporter subunit IID n=1 Tax=Plantactinospora sonchi TaxID=1544735 RepID=A0ABU7S294_9ACTN
MPTTTERASEPTAQSDAKEIRQLVRRSLLLQGAFNYERFQNLGLWWVLRPMLDRLYPDRTERTAAYKRHLVYFNTHPWTVGPVLGVVAGMERKRAAGAEELTDETINSVKVGMMAPLAGIGDSMVFGTIRPIMGGVCAALAVNGNIAGPIIFFLGLLVIQFAFRIYGTSLGYRHGTRFFEHLDPAQIERLKSSATILGLAVTGALVATLLKVSTPLSYHNGEATLKLQESLDQVLPFALPLAATLVVFMLMRRRVSPIIVLLGAAVVGFVGGYFGVLA